MMQLLDHSPHDFILHHTSNDLKSIKNFVHRTFNVEDFRYFISGLHHIYTQHDGLEAVFRIPPTK